MITCYSLTHIGNYKENNEDYFYCAKENDENKLYLVCDGVGGYSGGEIASKFVVDYIVKNFDRYKFQIKNPLDYLKEIIYDANNALISEQNRLIQYNLMGTTLSIAWIISKNMFFASVGDSRIYLYNKELKQLSEDHNILWNKYLKGELTKEEMRLHPNNNIITSMLGRKTIDINVGKIRLFNKDEILICSDGLTDMVSEAALFDIFKTEESIDFLGEKLLDAALKNGGKDNITLEILKYEISE